MMFMKTVVPRVSRVTTTCRPLVHKNNLLLSKRFLSSTTAAAPRPKRDFSIKRIAINVFKVGLYTTLAGVAYVSYSLYRETNPAPQLPQTTTFPNGSPRKTVVILGSGWGSVSLLKNLDTSLYNVVVVSPRNYFLYTPLLPSTPVGTVEMKSIVEPIRSIARRSPGEVTYYETEALDVNPTAKTVTIGSSPQDMMDIHYDYLVMGVGAEPTTFGIPGVRENASFLKEIPDAQEIRTKIMNNIQKATTLPPSDPERKRLLSFVVVGGGPTGVEFAAELQDYVDQDLKKWIPEISKEIKVTLVEATPNILNMFDKSLIEYAEDLFKEEKIEVRLKTMVKKVDSTTITAKLSDGSLQEVPYGMLVWATGNGTRKITKNLMEKLPTEQTSKRGLLIDSKLRLLGAEDSIFALGDCTFHPGLFPTAQVAYQEGIYLAKLFKKIYKIDQLKWKLSQQDAGNKSTLQSKLENLQSNLEDFKYNHLGALAYIGSDKAIADLAVGESKYSMSGSFTFLFWRSAYLAMCLSFRNRILVTLDWIKVSLLGRNSSV